MSKKQKTVDIVCVIDRSGSMLPLTKDVIGGFNKFLEEQKGLPGKANMTLAMFNHEYNLVYDRASLDDVKDLDAASYIASGMTALYDAIGKTVSEVRATQKKKTPTIMAIFTDGEENNSKEYRDRAALKEMLEKLQKKNKWEIHFIGVGIDAFSDAKELGILHANAQAASASGVAQTYDSYTTSVAKFRQTNT